jgi:hypothetical protein
LELHADKARLIEFGRFAARDRKYRGERKPETFTFLGFTHFCGQLNRIGFRLQGDPEPLDTYGIARFIELYSRHANARVIAPRDQPRKEVELTIRATHGSRI